MVVNIKVRVLNKVSHKEAFFIWMVDRIKCIGLICFQMRVNNLMMNWSLSLDHLVYFINDNFAL